MANIANMIPLTCPGAIHLRSGLLIGSGRLLAISSNLAEELLIATSLSRTEGGVRDAGHTSTQVFWREIKATWSGSEHRDRSHGRVR
jgi:hypothetical protein